MVVHDMSLFAEGFEMIKSGKKVVEIRLNDEKRKAIKPGDRIDFWLLPDKKERLKVKVINLETFSSFEKAYRNIRFDKMGRGDKTIEWMIDASYDYYTWEDEMKCGILAIHFEVV